MRWRLNIAWDGKFGLRVCSGSQISRTLFHHALGVHGFREGALGRGHMRMCENVNGFPGPKACMMESLLRIVGWLEEWSTVFHLHDIRSRT